MAPNASDSAEAEADAVPNTVEELRNWLWEQVADECDIVVDEMQKEHFARLEKEDDERDDLPGSEEYKANMEAINKGIAELKEPGCTKGLVSEKKQKITDGLNTCWYGGTKDNVGRPHGEGMLKYNNNDIFQGRFDHGVLNREGKLIKSFGISYEGKWKDGLMDGEMKMSTVVGGWIEGYWKYGVPHGFQREFGIKDFNDKVTMRFVGRYYRGLKRGFCWKGCWGTGFICGEVDKEGEFSGNDIAYIYPCFKMAIRGEFKNDVLVSARLCELSGFEEKDGMLMPTFTEPTGRVFCYEHPSKLSIAINRTLPDPWEAERVVVGQSKLPQGGEGLFAKRDIPKKSLVSLYNGVRIRTCTYASKHMGHSDYRIRLNADVDLDIPADCIKLGQYCATLGHKVNHSNVFNTQWVIVEHPRFGIIRGLATSEDLKEGDEILINYHINLADGPEWYKKVWLRHQREVKKMSDESIMRVLLRYRENTSKHVDLDLDDDEFFVPEPTGVAGLEELPDEEGVQDAEPDQSCVEMVKKMLKVNDSAVVVDGTNDEPKITEI